MPMNLLELSLSVDRIFINIPKMLFNSYLFRKKMLRLFVNAQVRKKSSAKSWELIEMFIYVECSTWMWLRWLLYRQLSC